MRRTVLLHHHIFKNAGSTVDAVLTRNFSDRAVLHDKPVEKGKHLLSPDEVKNVLDDNPQAVSLSSHQLNLQRFSFWDVDVIDLALVRHPVDRLRSMHQFYNKSPQLKTPLALCAQNHSLGGFVEQLLGEAFRRHARDFQTLVFGANTLGRYRRPTAALLASAKERMAGLACPGVVEHFDESMAVAETAVAQRIGPVDFSYRVVNRTSAAGSTLESRLACLRDEIGQNVFDRLCEMNRLDIELWEFARRVVLERAGSIPGIYHILRRLAGTAGTRSAQ